jgi:hypothetical protein
MMPTLSVEKTVSLRGLLRYASCKMQWNRADHCCSARTGEVAIAGEIRLSVVDRAENIAKDNENKDGQRRKQAGKFPMTFTKPAADSADNK